MFPWETVCPPAQRTIKALGNTKMWTMFLKMIESMGLQEYHLKN